MSAVHNPDFLLQIGLDIPPHDALCSLRQAKASLTYQLTQCSTQQAVWSALCTGPLISTVGLQPACRLLTGSSQDCICTSVLSSSVCCVQGWPPLRLQFPSTQIAIYKIRSQFTRYMTEPALQQLHQIFCSEPMISAPLCCKVDHPDGCLLSNWSAASLRRTSNQLRYYASAAWKSLQHISNIIHMSYITCPHMSNTSLCQSELLAHAFSLYKLSCFVAGQATNMSPNVLWCTAEWLICAREADSVYTECVRVHCLPIC